MLEHPDVALAMAADRQAEIRRQFRDAHLTQPNGLASGDANAVTASRPPTNHTIPPTHASHDAT